MTEDPENFSTFCFGTCDAVLYGCVDSSCMRAGEGTRCILYLNGGERESAGKALGGIKQGRRDRPSVTGVGVGAPFFFWRRGRLEEKKGHPEVTAVWFRVLWMDINLRPLPSTLTVHSLNFDPHQSPLTFPSLLTRRKWFGDTHLTFLLYFRPLFPSSSPSLYPPDSRSPQSAERGTSRFPVSSPPVFLSHPALSSPKTSTPYGAPVCFSP